ncbi:MAG: TolB-like 6-bladed beta-propeller domain-containing protein [Prevotellaceae bacterium]|jgi:hypothetical protein|nr:TolB-like 6-bladed beta-propeller domain-containing protein [Prevotellaceae bacterium]
MKTRNFIVLCVLFLVASCEVKKSTPVLKTIFPLDSLTVFQGLPVHLTIYEPKQKLFVIDHPSAGNNMINVIDITSDSLSFSFARKGQGPNEYLSVSNIEIYEEKSKLIVGVFDLSTNIYRKYDYDSLIFYKENVVPLHTQKNNTEYRFHYLYKIDSGYIATGFFTEGKFAILDTALKMKHFSCEYRPKPSRNIPDKLNAKANHGFRFLSPDRKFLGNTIYIASVLNLYKIDGNEISPQWEYVLKEIDYDVRDGNYVNTQVEGYLSGCMTDSRIYVLYCGIKKDMNATATYARELHVFNYDGILVEKFDMGRDLFGICIDNRRKRMYAITHNPEPRILIYELP